MKQVEDVLSDVRTDVDYCGQIKKTLSNMVHYFDQYVQFATSTSLDPIENLMDKEDESDRAMKSQWLLACQNK